MMARREKIPSGSVRNKDDRALVEALAAALASSPSGDVARVLAVKGRQGMDAGGG